jgi:hypothetical protein
VLARWDGRDHQKWRFIQDDRGEIYIETKASKKVVGIVVGASGSVDRLRPPPALRVEQSADTGAPSQRWKLLPLD